MRAGDVQRVVMMRRAFIFLVTGYVSLMLHAQTTTTAPATRSLGWQQWEVEHQKWKMERLQKAGPAKAFGALEAWTKVQDFRTLQLSGGAAKALGTKIDWGSGFPVTLPGSPLHQVYKAQDTIIAVYGRESLENAQVLNDVGQAFVSRGDYGDIAIADLKLSEAMEIVGKVLAGVDHPDAARVHNNLGLVRMNQGKNAEARRLIGEGIRMISACKGEEDAETIRYRQNLAVTYLEAGEWATARQILREAEKGALAAVAGPAKGTPLSERLATLALIYINQSSIDRETGNYAQERMYLHLAIARMEEQEHLLKAKATMEHALAQAAMGKSLMNDPTSGRVEIDQAEAHLNKALTMLADRGMSFNPKAAEVMETLAMLRFERDDEKREDRQKAGELMERALRIRRSIGQEMIGLGPWVQLEIRRLTLSGDYVRAAEVARDYSKILAKGGGLDAARASIDYATLLDALGKHDEAEERFQMALKEVRRSLDQAFVMQSEREQLQTISIFRRFLDAYLSHCAVSGRLNQEAYGQVLAWKGLVFERQRAMRSLRSQPSVKQMLEELATTSRRLAALDAHRRANPEAVKERDQQIVALVKRMDELQGQLGQMASKVPGESATGSDALAKALPAGVALLDFLRYADTRPPKSRSGKWAMSARYVVFVVSEGRVRGMELGDAEQIESALAQWRGDREFGLTAGSRLRSIVWKPIEAAIACVNIVIISPDGPISALPFAALPADDAGNGVLLERYAFASVAVPSRLPAIMARRQDTWAASGALLVGGVDFDEAKGKPIEVAAASNSMQALRGNDWARWNPLPGTLEEVRMVRQIIGVRGGAVEPLEGAAATKLAFASAAQGKRFVHLATHGFFSGGEFVSSIGGSHGGWVDAIGVDPGLLCGVCLAGANRPVRLNPDGSIADGGGILTATEVAQMDFAQTQTVVLSACETGLGVTRGGEGVLGLQRAFQLAGARSVVASLWKVDDQRTRQLMTSFYRRLLEKGAQPITALRGAQLELARLRGAPHPSLWGAWVISGDAGDLAAAIREMDQPIELLGELPTAAVRDKPVRWWRWGGGGIIVLVVVMILWRRCTQRYASS